MSGIIRTDPFAWKRGAVWLLPDGSSIVVPGFHDDWIAGHQDLVEGCANVCDVVLKKRWLSVVAYSQGYVEIMIPSREDQEAVDLCVRHLALNLEQWSVALVMTMDEEGYARLESERFGSEEAARQHIRGSAPAVS